MTLRARLLENLAPWRAAPAWRVALSAGLDSTVLVHQLAQLAQCEQLPPISAIHIHHGLQAVADAWPEQCRALCRQLNVPLHVVYVQVAAGPSVEQAARQARYRAFAECLSAGEVLLTAQHRDDQAETLLFRLLRGAGVRGLSGMPAVRSLGAGSVLRPLLNVSRAELLAYAQAQELDWVDDPSNSDERFSRNYLRHQVMPLIEERWPRATASMARSAELLSEAGQLLDERAIDDLDAARPSAQFAWLKIPVLALPTLQGLSEARQRNALRYWLRPLTRMPDAEHWAGWVTLRDAAVDATPVWRLESGEIRRSNDCIWWLSGDFLKPIALAEWRVPPEQVLELPGNGRLHITGVLPAGDWTVGYRQPGEQVELPGRGHRDLKRLFNEWRLPQFVRDRLPLLRLNGRVVAIANMPAQQYLSGGACVVKWIPPTSDQGLS
jgi:tRNA(Ile)-lysidine synthase